MENHADLTPKEHEVLQYIGEGLTNVQIAQRLHTSVRTIETRRQSLIRKTKSSNTATLIKYAVKTGLIS